MKYSKKLLNHQSKRRNKKLSYALVLPFCGMSGRGNRAKIHRRAVLLSLILRISISKNLLNSRRKKICIFSLDTSVQR